MKRRDRELSPEQALREVEARMKLEDLDPSGPVYEAVKAQLTAGEITTDQAVIELMKDRRPKFERSFAGFPVFPKSEHRITTDMVRNAEDELDFEDWRRLNPSK